MVKIIILMASLLTAVSCGSSNGGKDKNRNDKSNEALAGFSLSKAKIFQVKAEWAMPLKAGGNGDNSVLLTFLDSAGAPGVSTKLLAFHPRMPAMGHGTDESTQVILNAEATPNVVTVSGIYFNMGGSAGEWVVDLNVEIDDTVDISQLSVPNVD